MVASIVWLLTKDVGVTADITISFTTIVAFIAVLFGASNFSSVGAFAVTALLTAHAVFSGDFATQNMVIVAIGVTIAFAAIFYAKDAGETDPYWQLTVCALPVGVGTVFGGMLIILKRKRMKEVTSVYMK